MPRNSGSGSGGGGAGAGAGTPGLMRAEVLVLGQRSAVPGRGAEARLVPLTRADLVERFPLAAACALLVVKRLGGFNAMATGPWLRDRLVRLLDDAEEMGASKL